MDQLTLGFSNKSSVIKTIAMIDVASSTAVNSDRRLTLLVLRAFVNERHR